jgi:toxin-antitoxin system PIN domain toxin
MIAVDTNVLVYAHRREATEHATASATLVRLAQGAAPWAIPWPCLYEFLSVVTNPKIWGPSVSTQAEAWRQVEVWAASPSVTLLVEPPDFVIILRPFICRARVLGGVVHDARVAALCVAHGVERLLTRDRDFSLFPELERRDPFRGEA